MADRVVVMYAGQVVETGTVEEIFTRPLMPYTSGLMQSIPRMGESEKKLRLQTIPGYVPLLTKLPGGCRFRTRCAFAEDRCAVAEPPLEELESGRSVRCIRWRELELKTKASA
jgi:peptide/nickel transport system ATP-binding protein/oligopeptide transport system ATP-binding protein